ncbi:MAG: DUF58 domain-containing protein [Planctomycetota bacterium]|jgi:uncharacterized protein (DUF58 family)|nr:DUF58 domain-containing protein [Planctomycetota bacterium]MDP7134260.1 DUF58 domain-containing protein [Planctomycetota bacterium]
MAVDTVVTSDDLARFKRTELIARSVVEGFVSGLHKSPFKGFALDFSHYREYTRGDEVKHLDWSLYARTDKYYVKQYDEFTVLKSHILLDTSGSMNYTSGTVTKFDYARFIAAVLTNLLITQKDSVGLVTFDTEMRKYLPPKNTSSQLARVMHDLSEVEPGGETSLGGMLKQLASSMKRRGLIILISDLFDLPGEIRGALAHFAKRRHEIVVFRVLDEAERTFPFKKFTKFVDMEGTEHLLAEPNRIRKEYMKRFNELEREIQEACYSMAIDYVPVYTNRPPEYALAKYLSLRMDRNK